MRKVTIFFLLGIFHVFIIRDVVSECDSYRQHFLVDRYNGTTQEFLIWSGMVHSKMECIYKCHEDFRCSTFQYAINGACKMYATNINLLKAMETETELGVVTFQMRFGGTFGGECITIEECTFPNSECRQSACVCIKGYSFNPIKTACTNGCAEYSKSYAIFPETAVYGMDLSYHYNVGSVEDCQNVCSTDTSCKSFDYLPLEAKCILKSGGGLDKSFVFKDNTIHGVRNCYN